jgi:hypothetical protein
MPARNLTIMTPEDLKWWGEIHFDIGQSRAWRFGSLYVRITRNLTEWQLEYHRPRHQDAYMQDWETLDIEMPFSEPTTLERYLFGRTSDKISLYPRLANRSVIVKPINPIYIPPGQQGTMFVSTPLWMAGFVEGQKEPIFDIAINRPKDSWFGPDTKKGELCYATPVDGRTDIKQLEPLAFRAVTPIHFHNTSNSMMLLRRMNLPVPALPLFHNSDTGRLWTSQIKVIQDAPNRPPRIKIENRTPPQAAQVAFIQPPRFSDDSLFNMFDSFF